MKTYKSKKIGQPFVYAFFSILIIFFLVCMITRPAHFMSQALSGLNAWAMNVLPSVLPFMFFTRVLSTLNFMPKLTRPLSPLSSTLFKTPPISIYAFTMAILSGYPVGSKMVADLYFQGKISKNDAFKMSSFCSTSGPMFIVGAVGIGMFHSSKIGYILFLSHVLGAILNGVLFRNYKLKENKISITETEKLQPITQTPTKKEDDKEKNPQFDIAEIVLNSTLAILSVGCIITIFFIVIECFSPILHLLPEPVAFLFEGLIEITKGCLDLATLSNKIFATVICSFVISFGGISTLMQSLTMLSKLKMPVKLFAFQKFTHACFSVIITLLLLLVVPV